MNFELKLEIIVVLELKWYAALSGLVGLDVSPACLGSYNWSCIDSIGARPIGQETRHIMAELW